MSFKKITGMAIALIASVAMMAACGSPAASESPAASAGSSEAVASEAPASDDATESAAAGMTGTISVNSREDGSGTRDAFTELFGILQENENGEEVDMTTTAAAINNSTNVMMTTVAGNPQAIGYISLGSLNDTVKALQVNGVDATAENIKSGDYTVSRPFNIATRDDISEVAQDFVDFIMSAEGQAVITEEGYIAIDDAAEAYSGSQPSGTVTVAGSSSVTPVMEKLAEAYEAVNGNATVQVQQSDSSTGMTNAIEGVCDIGMASREVKDSELEQGLTSTTIAMDGIAVIVNNENPLTNITTEQVMQIYTGEITDWSEIG